MPLEIKELHIKASLSDSYPDENRGGESNNGGVSGNISKDEIINLCVDKVLQILKDKMER